MDLCDLADDELSDGMPTINVLEPGLVVIRAFIDESEQRRLAAAATEWGSMYAAGSEGLQWHRDIYENDGQSDRPVVNLSVGASCVFGIRCPSGLERHVLLRSGDCLLFGGPCRFAEHAVLDVRLDDRPSWMAREEAARRFSFTFRDSPEVRGREEEFK